MKGYLQSIDCASERLEVGPDEHSVVLASAATASILPQIGCYSVAGGDRVLFYRWEGVLRLRVGTAEPILLGGLEAEWSFASGQAVFILKNQERVVFEHAYQASKELATIGDDLTPFIEAEDFDIFLFVRNVLADSRRAERVYRAC